MSASTTQGSNLNEKELELIEEACDISVKLNDAKVKIFDYVESRMTFIAPNLSKMTHENTLLIFNYLFMFSFNSFKSVI